MLQHLENHLELFPVCEDYSFPRLSRDAFRVRLVADTLAWAVSHGMPLQEALRNLPFYRGLATRLPKWRSCVALLRDVLVPFRPLLWFPNIRWSWAIRLMIEDLERGEPLSSALEKHLGEYFPGFYVMGVAKAERDGLLETALPVLARQVEYPAAMAGRRKLAYFLSFWRFIIIVPIILLLFVFILPVFKDMYGQFGGTMPYDIHTGWTLPAIVAQLGCFVILVFLLLSKIQGLGEYVLLRFPLLGPDFRRFVLSDLARSMAAFVRQGEDLVSAAEWSMKSTRSYWLRRRLEEFVTALRRGVYWPEAWDKIGKGTPLEQWLVRNAAAREDPAAGLELLAEWLQQEIELTTRWIERWVDPCATVVIGLIVGLMTYFFLLPIFYMHSLVM